jgi:hypothetical protein
LDRSRQADFLCRYTQTLVGVSFINIFSIS